MNPFSVERAMISFRSCAACVLMLLAISCHPDAVTNPPVVAKAGIHYVHAVPDTMQLDTRVVDRISNSGLFDANFRGFDMFYKDIEAGTREIKVFLSSPNPAISSTFIFDTTFTFTEGQNYSFIHAGFARTGQTPARTVWILQDNATNPGVNQVGFRFVHGGAGMGAVDVNVIRKGTDTLPDTPLAGNVTFGTVRAYLAVKADSFQVQPNGNVLYYDTLRVVITAAGTKTPRLATTAAPLGVPGTVLVNPIPGAAIPGTVFTALVVPPSVAGSPAPPGFTTPTTLYMVDRRPPDTVVP
jgi:uncharacterized protein DUF4397